MNRMGYLFFTITLFMVSLLTHNGRLLSYFFWKRTGAPNGALELRIRSSLSYSSNYCLSFANSRGAMRYGGFAGGFTPNSNSMQWSTLLHGDRVFDNSSGITSVKSFNTSTIITHSWVVSTSSGSSFIITMKFNSSFRTPFFSCRVNICCRYLVPPQETGTMRGLPPPIRHKEFRNDIGTNFTVCMTFIPRIP